MQPILAFGLGGMEIIVILAIGLLLFGTRLPKLARSMGQSVNQFKSGLKEGAEAGEDDASHGDGSHGDASHGEAAPKES